MADRENLVDLLTTALDWAEAQCGSVENCPDCAGFDIGQLGKNCGFALAVDYLIANGVMVQRWIPVTERLPEKDGSYLCLSQYCGSRWCAVRGFAKDGRKKDEYDFQRRWKNVWFDYDSEHGYFVIDSITHWMPLPEPPKEGV